MEKLDNIAVQANGGGRVISLIGNHELLNILHNFEYVSPCSLKFLSKEQRSLLFTRKYGQFSQILSKRNIIVKVGKYLFCHGGLLPMHLDYLEQVYGNTDINNINILFHKFMLCETLNEKELKLLNDIICSNEGILWTRFYMHLLVNNLFSIYDVVLKNILTRTDAISMFIGHNIVPNITSVSDSKLFFVDAALSRAFNTTRIQVLEITTLPNGQDSVNLIEIPC